MKAFGQNKLVTPFLKWVGGKRQLLPRISECLPTNIKELAYYEPFIGGGALFFSLQPAKAVINDYNPELINVYQVIKDDLDRLIMDLKKHKNTQEYFYSIRSLDRSEEFLQLNKVQRASRIIYLNKTCYNGLYRVNNAGEFNVPFGHYKNPNIVNEPTLKAVNKYLNKNNILIKCGDYSEILDNADENSFVYLDPPYHPVSETSNFTGYIQGGWDKDDQIRLREYCDSLNQRGVKFLLSNSSSDFILELYSHFRITTVKALRSINSVGSDRGQINEVLIRNYE